MKPGFDAFFGEELGFNLEASLDELEGMLQAVVSARDTRISWPKVADAVGDVCIGLGVALIVVAVRGPNLMSQRSSPLQRSSAMNPGKTTSYPPRPRPSPFNLNPVPPNPLGPNPLGPDPFGPTPFELPLPQPIPLQPLPPSRSRRSRRPAGWSVLKLSPSDRRTLKRALTVIRAARANISSGESKGGRTGLAAAGGRAVLHSRIPRWQRSGTPA